MLLMIIKFKGLLGGDKVLAGGLWRSLFLYKEDIDPKDIEVMVHYIRKQVVYCNLFPSENS